MSDQGHQSTQQGFDTIEANEPMPANHNTARTNTDLQQVPVDDAPRRRGGRPTARRGKPFARQGRETERRQRLASQSADGQNTSKVLSKVKSQQESYKKQPSAKQQTRLNPYARPFVSQKERATPNAKASSSQQPAIGKHNLNPQAPPFHPAKSIGEQGLDPQAAPFHPANKSPLDDAVKRDHIDEKRKAIVDPDAPPCLEEVVKFKRVRQHMLPAFVMPVESTPQLNQHFTNENRLEPPKAPEAAADPIIEQQRLEALMQRVAEQKEFARQRDAQEKLRLEQEQMMMALKEEEEQRMARQLEEETWRRHQEEAWRRHQEEAWRRYQEEAWRRCQEEELRRRDIEQQQMEAFMKRIAEEKEFARQRELQEKLRLEEEQKMAACKEKEEQEMARRLEEEELRRKAIKQKRAETLMKRTAELTGFAGQIDLHDKEGQRSRRRGLQEMLRRQEEQKIMARKEKEEQEKARRLEEEALKRRQEEECKRQANEERIKEIATIYNMKQNKIRKFIQEKSKPWLSRSRHSIEKRNVSIARRAEILRFSVKLHNNNPYSSFKIDNLYKRYKLRTPEIMEDRAKIALQAEAIAEEFNAYKDEAELMSYVWRNENFNGFAYREVAKKLYQPQIEGKHAWTHLISCDPTATHSMKWFSHKFGLDNEFRKNTTRYEEVDVTTKLVYSTEQLSPKLNNEVEAITFVLPEKRVENECHDNEFWQSQRDRLAKLIEALSKDRPDFQCPLLITYYSDDISDVHDTLYNIPELLGFKDEKTIMDYHVLLMRKESITTRICDEMFWLFGASVTC